MSIKWPFRRKRTTDPILRKIDSVRRALIVWMLGWGYLWAALLVAVAIFAGVLADHWFVLQKGGRLAFFRAFTWSAVGAVLFATLWPLLRRTGRLYVARRMEMRRPDLKNTLISYLECRGDPSTPRELKRLMARKAAPHIRSLDSRVAVEPGRYLKLAATIGAVVGAFGLYALFSPKSAGASVRRLMDPRADILPPTATRLTAIEPGDLYVLSGSEPRIAVTVAGVRPDGVSAVWDGTSFSGRRVLLVPKGPGRWEGAFPPLLEDGSYYLVAGDTRSDRFVIKVLPTPAVTGVRLTLTPPAYTGFPVQTVDDGSADVIQGTEVAIEARTNLPAQAAHLLLASGRRLWMDVAPDGAVLRYRFSVRRSERYSIHFETVPYPNGATFGNPSPVNYELTCRLDQPPAIRLLAPPDGLEVARDARVTLRYAAHDDFGLAAVRLYYRVNDRDGPAQNIATPAARAVPQGRYEWDLAAMPLRPGIVLTYSLEAVDNRPDVPQTARTEERRLIIPGPEPTQSEQPAAAADRGRPDETQPNSERRPDGEATRKEAEAGQPGAGDAQPDSEGTPPPEAAKGRAGEGGEEARGDDADALDQQARRIARAMAEGDATTEGAGTAAGEGGRESNGADATAPLGDSQGEQAGERSTAQEGAAGQADGSGQEAVQGPSNQQGQEGQSGSPGAPSNETGQGNQQAPSGQSGQQGQGAASGGSSGESGQQGQGAPSGGSSGESAQQGQGAASGGSSGQGGEQGQGGPSGAASGHGGQEGQGAPSGGSSGQGGQEGQGAASGGSSGQGGQEGQGAASGGSSGQGGQQGSSPASGSASGETGTGQAGSATPGSARGAPGAGGSGASGTPGSSPSTGASPGGGVRSMPAPGPREGPLSQADLDRAMEDLARRLENGDVPGGVLKDLGMDREQLQEFVARYREARRRDEAETGAGTAEKGHVVESPAAAAEDVRAADGLPDKLPKDALRARFEDASDHLAARYRDVVQQYYKTLSEAP